MKTVYVNYFLTNVNITVLQIFVLQPPSSIRSTPAAVWSAPHSKTAPSRPDPAGATGGYSPTRQKEEDDKELKTSVSSLC